MVSLPLKGKGPKSSTAVGTHLSNSGGGDINMMAPPSTSSSLTCGHKRKLGWVPPVRRTVFCVLSAEYLKFFGLPVVKDCLVLATALRMLPQKFCQVHYSEKVDVWGAGVLLHALVVGIFPSQGDSLEAVFKAIKNVQLDFNSGIRTCTEILSVGCLPGT